MRLWSGAVYSWKADTGFRTTASINQVPYAKPNLPLPQDAMSRAQGYNTKGSTLLISFFFSSLSDLLNPRLVLSSDIMCLGPGFKPHIQTFVLFSVFGLPFGLQPKGSLLSSDLTTYAPNVLHSCQAPLILQGPVLTLTICPEIILGSCFYNLYLTSCPQDLGSQSLVVVYYFCLTSSHGLVFWNILSKPPPTTADCTDPGSTDIVQWPVIWP